MSPPPDQQGGKPAIVFSGQPGQDPSSTQSLNALASFLSPGSHKTPKKDPSMYAHLPPCAVCGGISKQMGRAGQRVKEGVSLCGNCEDCAKRFKKEGLRRSK